MRIAQVRAHVLIIFWIAARRGNIAIAVGARLRNVAGSIRIGLTATLVAGIVPATLAFVVAGLIVRAGIFCVSALDLRVGLGEFVLQLDVRRVLVLIVLVVLGRAFSALVLA